MLVDASFLQRREEEELEDDDFSEDLELIENTLPKFSSVNEFEKELKMDLDDEEVVRNLTDEKQDILREIRENPEYQKLKQMSITEINSMKEFNFFMYQEVRQETAKNPTAPFYAHNAEIRKQEFMKCKYDILYYAENYVTLPTVSGRIKFLMSDEIRTFLRLAEASVFSTFQTSRQSSKSTSTHVVASWYFNFWQNSKLGLVNTTVDAGKKNLRYIMDINEGLPDWMNTFDLSHKKTIDNVFSKLSPTNSELRTAVVDKNSPEASLRGNTFALIIEEIAFLKSIHIAYSPISFTYNTYSVIAAQTYTPAPFLVVTTPNDVNSNEGAFFFELWEGSYLVTYELIKDMLPFEIKEFFDSQGIAKVKVFAPWYTFPNRASNPKLFEREDFNEKIKPILDNPEATLSEVYAIDKGLGTWLLKTKALCRTIKDVKKEIYCLFLSTNDNAIFEEETIDELNRAGREPLEIINLNGYSKYLSSKKTKDKVNTSKKLSLELKMYEKINIEATADKLRYFLTIDPAFSLQGDYCSFLIIDILTFKVIGTLRARVGKVHNIKPIIKEIISDVFNGRCIFSVENNSIGVAVKEDCESDPYLVQRMYYTIYEGKYAHQKDSDLRVYGHSTNTATRPLMMIELVTYILEKSKELKCKDLIQEITLLEEKNNKIQASKGSHDDLSLALAQALYILIHEKAVIKKLTFSAIALKQEISKINILNSRDTSVPYDIALKSQMSERNSSLAKDYDEQFEAFKLKGKKAVSGMFRNLNR